MLEVLFNTTDWIHLIFFEPEVLKTHNWLEKIKVNLTDLGDENHDFGLQKLSTVRFFHEQNYFQMFPSCIDHDVFKGIVPPKIIIWLDGLSTKITMYRLQELNSIYREMAYTINVNLKRTIEIMLNKEYLFNWFRSNFWMPN